MPGSVTCLGPIPCPKCEHPIASSTPDDGFRDGDRYSCRGCDADWVVACEDDPRWPDLSVRVAKLLPTSIPEWQK